MPKQNKKEPAVQRTIYVPKELDLRILKYISNKNDGTTYSKAINDAIKDFLKLRANQDELSITTRNYRKYYKKRIKARDGKNYKTSRKIN